MDIRILGALPIGGGGDDDDGPPPRPQPDAAAMTLREHFAAYAARPRRRPRPGDLVVFKRGLDPRPKSEWEQPVLLARVDRRPAWLRRFTERDGMVMVLAHDGTSSLVAVDRRTLEPWPRAESPGEAP